MLRTSLLYLDRGLEGEISSAELYLEESDLEDFLSILHDTTLATSNRGQNQQLLDVFYGTLIVCMIRYVLFFTFRYCAPQYKPLHSKVSPDPTFLDGNKSQLYEPMLLLFSSSIASSRTPFQEWNAYVMRAAAVVEASSFGSGPSPLPTMGFMYQLTLAFIQRFTNLSVLLSLD